MTAEQITNKLMKDGSVIMTTEEDIVNIWWRKFFGTERSFLFQLNAKPWHGCKLKKTAIKRIQSMIDDGFVLSDE